MTNIALPGFRTDSLLMKARSDVEPPAVNWSLGTRLLPPKPRANPTRYALAQTRFGRTSLNLRYCAKLRMYLIDDPIPGGAKSKLLESNVPRVALKMSSRVSRVMVA